VVLKTSDRQREGFCDLHGRSPKLAAFATFAGPPDLLNRFAVAAHSTRDGR
jgi:hypothetical protein